MHASVDVYLRAHPDYWRRLPARFAWSDVDWVARAERLLFDIEEAAPAEEEAAPVAHVASDASRHTDRGGVLVLPAGRELATCAQPLRAL